jgi:putative flippase GtrA
MSHINDVTIAGAVIFLVWVGIQAGIPKKFSPLVATVLSVLFAFFYLDQGNFLDALIHGILIAASAVGFHSGTKNMYQQLNDSWTGKNKNKS